MQKLLANYLFQHKKLVLPNVGTLEIRNAEAVAVASEQKITAPVPVIDFSDHAGDNPEIADYIAANKHISCAEADHLLKKFCEEIQHLAPGAKVTLNGAGSFYRDADDKIDFEAITLPGYYYPDVHAERVIHPDSAHSILVGDKETDSHVMTEYYAEEEPSKRQRWWIAAIILFLLAVGTIVYYTNDKGANELFGKGNKTELKVPAESYQKP